MEEINIFGKKYDISIQNIDIYNKQIKEIPKEIGQLINLQKLRLEHNQINEIPKEIGQLINLQYLNLHRNQINEIPQEIINLINLNNFSYFDNPIEYIAPNIQRFINRIRNRGGMIHNMYNDTQNIHSSSIQQSIRQSIQNLLKLNSNSFEYNYLDDSDFSIQTKQLLTEYIGDNSVHSILDITFGELFKQIMFHVLQFNFNKEIQIEIKKRISEEMEDAECKCFTGRMTRLVNSLSGFSDLVRVNISKSEEIGNIISIARTKLTNIDEIKEHVRREMTERGYGYLEEKINEWINYI